MQADSVVYIRSGIYSESVSMGTSGTEAKPIIFTSYPNESVVLDGNNTLRNGVVINGNFVTFKNMEIRNFTGTGATVNGAYSTVQNLYAHHNEGSGIMLKGSYDTADNCRAWYNSTMHENGAGSSWASGISAARSPVGCIIKNCTAWENWGEGISTFEAENTTIEDNVSYDNQIQFYISDAKGAIVQRNKAYSTPGNAVSLYYSQLGFFLNDELGFLNGETREHSSNNTLINNIAWGNVRNFSLAPECGGNLLVAHNTFADATSVPLFFYTGTLDAPGAQFTNNIIKQDAGDMSNNAQTGMTASYNIWSRTPGLGMSGAGDIIGDPVLDADYKPHALADGAGVASSVLTDFYGNARGNPPTIGAIE